MIKRGISRNASLLKQFAPKNNKIQLASYAKEAEKTSAESPAAKKLREQGNQMDKRNNELANGSFVRRVLYDRTKPEDINESMFKDANKFVRLINDFAKEGPVELVQFPTTKKPVTVTVTGAAGQIAYSLLPRIASGEMLGEDQPVILRLLERPDAIKQLEGTVMELQDCAFPLLAGIIPTSDVNEAFKNSDYAVLVGAKPRSKGMERGDLLRENAAIFAEQGKAINKNANGDILVLVVGNPANTNCLITAANAPDVPKAQFSALTRLDHDRGLGMIAKKAGVDVQRVKRFAVWGNHSATMYPDVSHTTIDGKWLRNVIKDEEWISKTFIPAVQQRGAAIINARGKSSAASAADASIKHMRDWVNGSSEWLSMAIYSDGLYGVPAGIYSSFPVICTGAGEYGVVSELPIDEFSAEKINASCVELLQEKEAISSLLPNPVSRFFEVDRKKVLSKEYALSQ